MTTCYLELPFRFDFRSISWFTDKSGRIFSNPATSNVVLEFSKVSYIDSSGLGMLVLLHRKSQALDKKISISGAHGAALNILTISQIQKLIPFI